MESVNVKVDEYLELYEFEHKNELRDYMTVIYYYDGMPEEEPKILAVEQVSMTVKTYIVNVELHLDTKLHSVV